ncbi:hypothetical protein OUZ56_012719 [Daphnia magna]|uniref:Uncharacterized protein n=1 Tax=Daphnia magna TaxID=35525 RepID=A0ABQ9Z3V7_9CRUS|nr:hypothetical protein OUZ56_012719 [Daphnia magna]
MHNAHNAVGESALDPLTSFDTQNWICTSSDTLLFNITTVAVTHLNYISRSLSKATDNSRLSTIGNCPLGPALLKRIVEDNKSYFFTLPNLLNHEFCRD